MTNMVYLIVKPFSLVQIFFLLGVRSVALATLVFWQLLKLIINFHVDLCWHFLILGITFMTLPIRMLTALKNEVKLERLLNEMQIQLENLVWENKELEERLQIAMEDRKVIEMILKEIEEEHEKAVTRIDLLENELQELKEENMRSNEVQGKTLWGSKSHYEKDVRSGESILIDTDYGSTSMHPSYNRRGLSLSDPEEPHEKGEALRQQRVVVLSRSLFSAFLSLLVGMIIWEAEDPCVPLVAALFTVVGISLGSVLEFFSAIRNRPASDAVALLSINWFILGTLSSRTLPVIAHMLAPSAIRIAVQLVGWLGFCV
ncbi:2OG-Fe(II) oxygenase superfamily [Musa troglodytarum]|uniref:2OG-Fe(II) oxygenase superfamily n=2 Tax=Musa troglodytarum TaxID=320322 RepID=A0A9E7GVP7_9LILI|nr:2OG-Fe(II) oxygenase superfamily [Musa troglodytarum]